MPTTLAFQPSPDDFDEGYFDVPVLTFSPPETAASKDHSPDLDSMVS